MNDSERRRFHRVNFFVDAWLQDSNGRVACTVQDLSLKGALVLLESLPQPMSFVTPLTLHIGLPDSSDHIHMQVRISRVHDDSLGLECEAIDLDSITHLRRIVELNIGDSSLLERELHALVA